jgi:hypothetical protein
MHTIGQQSLIGRMTDVRKGERMKKGGPNTAANFVALQALRQRDRADHPENLTSKH